MTKKLYIFSYGLYPEQITLETLAAIRECGEVYTHCLDAHTEKRLSRFAPGLKFTAGLDQARTAAATLAGLDRHETVGFLTYGNPLFLNQTAAELLKAARARKAEVKVFSAVSSFDSLVNLFGLNKYSPAGLRLLDAASFPDGVAFTPGMDTLVFVPYVLELPGYEACRKAFITGLAAAYPPGAPVHLADCKSISGKEELIKGKVRGIAPLLSKLTERHTMFIPAVK